MLLKNSKTKIEIEEEKLI